MVRVLNVYDIVQEEINCPFQPKIEELKKFQDANKVTLYTDAGVNIKTGDSAYGIIVSTDSKEIKIKAKLPTVDPTGATTAEHVSITVVLDLLKIAGIIESQIVTINNNQETI